MALIVSYLVVGLSALGGGVGSEITFFQGLYYILQMLAGLYGCSSWWAFSPPSPSGRTSTPPPPRKCSTPSPSPHLHADPTSPSPWWPCSAGRCSGSPSSTTAQTGGRWKPQRPAPNGFKTNDTHPAPPPLGGGVFWNLGGKEVRRHGPHRQALHLVSEPGNVNTSPATKGCGEEEFNCLFCYCPCTGTPTAGADRAGDGIKDCSYCLLPHNGLESYAYIQAKLMESPGAWEAGRSPEPGRDSAPRPHRTGQTAPRQPQRRRGSRSCISRTGKTSPPGTPGGAQPAACRGQAPPPAGGSFCAKEPARRVPRKSPEERALLRACVLREPVSMVGV